MNQYNQVLHLTQDTTWERDKNTRKHHIQESQEANHFPVGDRPQGCNESQIHTNRDLI